MKADAILYPFNNNTINVTSVNTMFQKFCALQRIINLVELFISIYKNVLQKWTTLSLKIVCE